MAKLVIAASPLVKVFLREWWDELMANPDAMTDFKTPFSFDIQRGCKAFKSKFNVPMEITGSDDKEVLNLYNWLTGGPEGRDFPETDPWGVVAYDPKVDLVARLDEMSRLESLMEDDGSGPEVSMKELKKLRDDSKKSMLTARADARVKAEERILRCMKNNHNNLVRQWQLNEEMKMGKYPPSVSELMGAHALSDQIKKANAKTQKVMAQMSELMGNQIVG